MRRALRPALGLALIAAILPAHARAQGALGKESLLEYIQGRTDLDEPERRAYEREIRVRFGGEALEPQDEAHEEIMVAKQILSAAIFLQVPAKQAVAGAWDGYHGALDYYPVPPPIAINYEILKFQGRPPRGRPIDLTFEFARFYNDEIAPDLVAYWEDALAKNKIKEWNLEDTKKALEQTRKLMRPLLLEKLRLLARLARDREVASGRRKSFLESAIRDVEAELDRSFRGVAASPGILDDDRPAYERLIEQLVATKKNPTEEDRALDPAVWREAAAKERTAREEKQQHQREQARRAREAEAERQRAEVEETRERLTAERAERERIEAEEREAERRSEQERRRLERERNQARIAELDERLRRERMERRANEERARQAREAKQREVREQRERERQARDKEARERADLESGQWTFAAIRTRLTSVVATWIGTPYVWGGTEKRRGTDCSGFTQGALAEGFSLHLPRTSRDQYREGDEVDGAPQPGDLVFFDIKDAGQISHVGVALGDGKFAHAGSSTGVANADLSARYFQRAYRGARRVIR
ncbi:MAG: C40 family peptidase [Deltaproteobacteria bacterium]|nr:C40 family peptidase [Deltaproteobacteria bacterium]